MKKIILSLFTCCLIAHGFTQTWQLVWSDEFEGNGLPDSDKWYFDTQGNNWDWGNNEDQNYTPATYANPNAWLEDGKLVIEARKEEYTWPGDGETKSYTSARLVSRGEGSWLYGRVEVRAKLPVGTGVWPAIWMLATNSVYGNWPNNGELDIMENVGYDPDRIHFTVHTESYNHAIGTSKGSNTLLTEPSNNYYTYGLQWYPDKVEFMVDDIVYFTFHKESDDYKVWPFNQPFHLLLNIAVGGEWGGLHGIDTTIFPQRMYVDYVRVYQQTGGEGVYNVNINTSEGGTVSKNPDQTTHNEGSQITLSATPEPEYRFACWTGDINSTQTPWTFNVVQDISATAVFNHWCDWVLNGKFDYGMQYWQHVVHEGATGTSEVSDGELHVNISNAGSDLWSNSVMQSDITIEQGEQYYFSFTARAEQNRTIYAGIGMNSAPWQTYLYEQVSLTPDMQTYKFNFVHNAETDSTTRVMFDLGQDNTNVVLDNIRLSCVDNDMTSNSIPEENKNINVYPNPAGDFLFLKFTEINCPDNLITITNTVGQTVPAIIQQKSPFFYTFNISMLSEGIYFIRMGEITRKFIKQAQNKK